MRFRNNVNCSLSYSYELWDSIAIFTFTGSSLLNFKFTARGRSSVQNNVNCSLSYSYELWDSIAIFTFTGSSLLNFKFTARGQSSVRNNVNYSLSYSYELWDSIAIFTFTGSSLLNKFTARGRSSLSLHTPFQSCSHPSNAKLLNHSL
jgi:CRISPR/Cas system-associated endonuclease Cas1